MVGPPSVGRGTGVPTGLGVAPPGLGVFVGGDCGVAAAVGVAGFAVGCAAGAQAVSKNSVPANIHLTMIIILLLPLAKCSVELVNPLLEGATVPPANRPR
jgi:hypothetical protein